MEIGKAIEDCDLVILVWSKAAKNSKYIAAEWTSAFENNKGIIPCIIDNTPLPPILLGLYYISFNNFEEGYSKLLCALKNMNKEARKLHNTHVYEQCA